MYGSHGDSVSIRATSHGKKNKNKSKSTTKMNNDGYYYIQTLKIRVILLDINLHLNFYVEAVIE